MKNVFVDSGGFFAALVAEDAHHRSAKRLFIEAKESGWSLVTTNAVLYETHALLISRVRNGRQIAIRFLESVLAGLCRVERTTADDEEQGLSLLREHEDKLYSLCDVVSFVVMERLGLAEAISFDRHFKEYGHFTILA